MDYTLNFLMDITNINSKVELAAAKARVTRRLNLGLATFIVSIGNDGGGKHGARRKLYSVVIPTRMTVQRFSLAGESQFAFVGSNAKHLVTPLVTEFRALPDAKRDAATLKSLLSKLELPFDLSKVGAAKTLLSSAAQGPQCPPGLGESQQLPDSGHRVEDSVTEPVLIELNKELRPTLSNLEPMKVDLPEPKAPGKAVAFSEPDEVPPPPENVFSNSISGAPEEAR